MHQNAKTNVFHGVDVYCNWYDSSLCAFLYAQSSPEDYVQYQANNTTAITLLEYIQFNFVNVWSIDALLFTKGESSYILFHPYILHYLPHSGVLLPIPTCDLIVKFSDLLLAISANDKHNFYTIQSIQCFTFAFRKWKSRLKPVL